LAGDFCNLVRSLGGWANKHEFDRTAEGKTVEYEVRFVLAGAFSPDGPKGQRLTERRSKLPHRRVVSVEPCGESEATCISVAHPSKLYITEEYIPTHNSTLAYAENVWCSTGQKHWTNRRGNVVVLSTGHQTYSTKVFRSKLIDGEDGDPLTPMIPEGGKWFHSFDQRGFIIRVACPPCAGLGRPRECTHTRNITCLSAESGVERLMGYTARLGHIDEHIDFDQYKELKQRLRRGGADGRMMITATPLAGQSWEITDLLELWKHAPENNWLDVTDHAKGPYVDVFQFSQYEVGFRSKGEIEGDRARMSEAEFLVRVMGEPMVIADNPVFNLKLLDQQQKENVTAPACFSIDIREGSKVGIDTLERVDEIMLLPEAPEKPERFEGLKVWAHPERDAQYVIGVDSAAGVSSTRRDASAAYVFRVLANVDGAIDLDMVAAWHSYDDVYSYAEKMKLVGIYYNTALIIPEVTGIGIPFMQALVRRLWYPNVWQGENTADQARADYDSRFGMVTNAQSKPNMVTALKRYIDMKRIKIRDQAAIRECQAFHQTPSQSGLSYRYEGAGGEHDDRVMAMCFVAYACVNFSPQVLSMNLPPLPPAEEPPPEGVVNTKSPKRGGGWSPW
jgi:hypothetical protein